MYEVLGIKTFFQSKQMGYFSHVTKGKKTSTELLIVCFPKAWM